jgi:hypothetical protein
MKIDCQELAHIKAYSINHSDEQLMHISIWKSLTFAKEAALKQGRILLFGIFIISYIKEVICRNWYF